MQKRRGNGKIAEAEELPDELYSELVDLMYTSWPSLVIILIAFAVTGAITAVRNDDVMLAAITVIGVSVAAVRILLSWYYLRRKGDHDRNATARRERHYAIGGWTFSLCIGAIGARVFYFDDVFSQMIVVTMTLSYELGMIVRVSVRPKVARVQFVLSHFPIGIMCFTHGDFYYEVLGAIYIIYLIGGFQLIAHLHTTILDRLIARHRLKKAAFFDVLTKLPNRRHLYEHLEQRLRQPQPVTVLYLDLDKFKPVNDTFGHEAGDRLLCRAADALAQETGTDGFVARLGGDEFVIVAAAHCDEAGIDALAERICRRLNAPFDLEEGTVAIGASIGIASGQGVRIDATALLRNADFALYQAKRFRATFRRFDPRETPPARPTSVPAARIKAAAAAS